MFLLLKAAAMHRVTVIYSKVKMNAVPKFLVNLEKK